MSTPPIDIPPRTFPSIGPKNSGDPSLTDVLARSVPSAPPLSSPSALQGRVTAMTHSDSDLTGITPHPRPKFPRNVAFDKLPFSLPDIKQVKGGTKPPPASSPPPSK